jgi:hypothetical protein
LSVRERETQSHRGVYEFVGYCWGLPQCRVTVLLAYVLMWIATGNHSWWGQKGLIARGVWLLLSWCAAELDMSAWFLLLLKLAIVVMAIREAFSFPDAASSFLCLAWVLAGTRLFNNIGARLMHVTAISTIAEFFK